MKPCVDSRGRPPVTGIRIGPVWCGDMSQREARRQSQTERSARRLVLVTFIVAATTLAAQQQPSQQQLPPGIKTGNPTPGTAQPDPPDLSMRITVTGCVLAVAVRPGGATDTADPN